MSPLTEEMEEERLDTLVEWTQFTSQRSIREIKQIDRILYAQRDALDQLRILDPGLYKMAIETDSSLLPFKAKGPLNTPPIPDYMQDGEYEDITKQYSIQYADMEEFLKGVLSKGRKRKKKKSDDDE